MYVEFIDFPPEFDMHKVEHDMVVEKNIKLENKASSIFLNLVITVNHSSLRTTGKRWKFSEPFKLSIRSWR